MKVHLQRLTQIHLYSFLGAYVAFAGLTLFTLSRQSQGDWQSNWNAAATLGAVSGPMTGAIARRFQSCCLEFSMHLLPWCAGFLIGAFMLQVVPIPFPGIEKPLRRLSWFVGVFVWFGGGFLSFLHAFS